MKKLLTLFLILFCFNNFTFSEEKEFNFWGDGNTFKLNPVLDGTLLPLSFGMNITSFFINKNKQVPDYSSQVFNTDDINSFDKPFINKYSKTLDKTGDVFMITGMLLPSVLAATNSSEWATIVTMYAESVMFANSIKELLKDSKIRPRPYNFFEGAPLKDINEGDWCRSWPSGHATMTFTGATFASYVFWKYFPDSPYRWLVLGGSYSVAITTSILRMLSGNHYFTDVLTGAAIGTICGFVIPWVHTLTINSKKDNGPEISANTAGYPFGFNICVKF